MPIAGTCFVAMPFAETYGTVYSAIKEAMESDELGFRCYRADEESAGGFVMETVLRELQEAEVVIADLTGRNANVFYELGIAHILKDARCVVLISQDEIPFDVRAYRCHRYVPSDLDALKRQLIASVKEITPARKSIMKRRDESYEHEDSIPGDDDSFYRFSIHVLNVAEKAAKLRLEVWPDGQLEQRQVAEHVLRRNGQNKARYR